MLLYYFLLDWWRAPEGRSTLPAIAAALAMLWNLGSLVALATGPGGGIVADVIVAASFSVLSLLPAVLLHISLQSRHRMVWLSGYVISAISVALHTADLLTQAPELHRAALLLVTLGFAGLTLFSVFLESSRENRPAGIGSRLAGHAHYSDQPDRSLPCLAIRLEPGEDSRPRPGERRPQPASHPASQSLRYRLGHDNLLGGDRYKVSARLTVVNLMDKTALYNFLSTFSGTHYVTPRAITASIGFHF